ncbi:MAG: chemotaxis protein CheW [Spirochaetota bacterium]
MAFTIGEYQDIFLEEADEQLQELNQCLLQLEKNPDDVEIDTINSIFRTAHSLKSSAAFVGLNDLSDLAHHMENLLQGIRDKTMAITPEIIEVLFQCFDLINSIISSVSRGEEPKQDLSATIEKIKNISENTKSSPQSPAQKPAKKENEQKEIKEESSKKESAIKIQYSQSEMKSIINGLKEGKFCCELDIYIDPYAQMKWIKAQLINNNLEQLGEVLKTIPSMSDISKDWKDNVFRIVLLSDHPVEQISSACEIDLVNKVELRKISLSTKDNKAGLKIHEKEILFEEKTEEVKPKQVEETKKDVPKKETSKHEEESESDEHEDISFGRRKDDKKAVSLKIVKVSVDKLDLLLNTVGELVIANSGFIRLFDEIKKSNIDKSIIGEFKNRMDQMSRIAKDLQSGIMKTRMVPIGQVLSRFNRPVRDLAKEFNKKINFVIKGEDTELDKKVIDVIGEPLLHLLRNCIDHGVETPEERRRLGKPEEAAVTINAYQGGNQIFVEIGDDGRGLDIEKIKKKALKGGLVTPDMLSNMDEDDIVEFIFRPGFSTADVITDISGRGVGMNVVKETVSELNGSVRIETEPGMGTNFVLSFPLTLAIIPAIMIKVQNEMYSIPLPDVIETIKITESDITTIEGREVVNLRGEILSLLRLNEFIGIKSSLTSEMKIPVVIVGYGNRKIGVIVDSLEGKQEIVIKSLEENYTNIDGLSGASILGDGSICLILDIASMINKVISDEEKSIRQKKSARSNESQENFSSLEEQYEEVKEKKIKSDNLSEKQTKSVSVKENVYTEPVKEKQTPAVTRKEEDQKITEDILFIKDEKSPKNIITSSGNAELTEDQIEQKVRDTLSGFKKELEENIKANTEIDDEDHIIKSLNIAKEDIEKINVIANVGIANAAESLSKILDKSVSLSIPEVEIIPIKNIAKTIGEVDTVYIGVFMPILGDVNGAVLFSFSEQSGFELIDMLYGLSTGKTKHLDQDGESALKEVTNIIGSSMINILSEKIKLTIRPDIPTIIHDYIQSTIDSILIQNNITGDYALSMNTYFYYHDDRVLGKLLILSEADSLKKMVKKLKEM